MQKYFFFILKADLKVADNFVCMMRPIQVQYNID